MVGPVVGSGGFHVLLVVLPIARHVNNWICVMVMLFSGILMGFR